MSPSDLDRVMPVGHSLDSTPLGVADLVAVHPVVRMNRVRAGRARRPHLRPDPIRSDPFPDGSFATYSLFRKSGSGRAGGVSPLSSRTPDRGLTPPARLLGLRTGG